MLTLQLKCCFPTHFCRRARRDCLALLSRAGGPRRGPGGPAQIRRRLVGPDQVVPGGRAIPVYEQTLADRRRVLSEDHPDTSCVARSVSGKDKPKPWTT